MGNIVVEKVWLTDTAVWIRTSAGGSFCLSCWFCSRPVRWSATVCPTESVPPFPPRCRTSRRVSSRIISPTRRSSIGTTRCSGRRWSGSTPMFWEGWRRRRRDKKKAGGVRPSALLFLPLF